MKLIFVENFVGDIVLVYTWTHYDINLGIMKARSDAKRKNIPVKRVWTETVKPQTQNI